MRFVDPPIRRSLVAPAVAVTVIVLAFATQEAQARIGHSAHPLPNLPGLHEKKHDAKRQVEALEEEWRLAQLNDDVSKMDALLSDDYIGITAGGQVSTKPQQLDRMRSHKLEISHLELGEMQIKFTGSIAIVTSRAEVEGTNDGLPLKGTFRYTRVYQRLPSGDWKITSFEATRVPSPGQRHRNGDDKDASNAAPLGPS